MKVLFLDIDGVLNTPDIFREHYYAKAHSELSDADKKWKYEIDEGNLDALKELMAQVTDLNIVVNSAWKDIITDDEFKARFSVLLGVNKDRILGATDNWSSKGRCAQEWLKEHKVDKFAILDDSNDMDDLIDYLFRTDGDIGLTRWMAEDIIKYFNSDVEKPQAS